MDSSLQARLFPGLAIKIQRSNGEGRGPEARGYEMAEITVPPQTAEGLRYCWGTPPPRVRVSALATGLPCSRPRASTLAVGPLAVLWE